MESAKADLLSDRISAVVEIIPKSSVIPITEIWCVIDFDFFFFVASCSYRFKLLSFV